MKKYLAFTLFAILLAAPIGMKTAFAADTWYVGKGLKEGDYFRYDLCQVDYKSCTKFEMDLWIKGKTEHGDWDMQVLVKEGNNKIVKGDMQVGRVAPEPIGFSDDIGPYASAYKSSIVWLSGFTTRLDPKDLAAPAWGKIGSIGGMQVGPTGQKETVTVPAGTFDTIVVGWHKSVDNKIWVAPNMPFPVKALTFVDVNAGTIPVQYQFELLEYGNTSNAPDFFDVTATTVNTEEQCPKDNSIKRGETSLDSHGMIIAYSYSPEAPRSGCEITWNFQFEKSFDPNQFESDVHYDIFVVDDKGTLLRSFAEEQGQTHLFAPVGKEFRKMDIKEPAGVAHYIIHVYGTGPDGTAPDITKSGSLAIDIEVTEGTRDVKESQIYASAMSADGSVHVDIESNMPTTDDEMTINVTFTDPDGNTIEHINYEITATQDGVKVLSESGAHEHGGKGTHVTDALVSDSPVDVQVTILGFGLPDQKATWTGPKGEVVSLQVVPEFPVSIMIILALVVAISVVITRFRNIPDLKF